MAIYLRALGVPIANRMFELGLTVVRGGGSKHRINKALVPPTDLIFHKSRSKKTNNCSPAAGRIRRRVLTLSPSKAPKGLRLEDNLGFRIRESERAHLF